jgi:cytidine deaminase
VIVNLVAFAMQSRMASVSSAAVTPAAIAAAVAKGVRGFELLVVATEAEEPTPPCGMCRQALVEFAPELTVVACTRAGMESRWTLGELLPMPFTPHSLERT